jgi:hypothetical protein
MRCFFFAVAFLALGMAYGDGQTDFPALIRSAAKTGGPTYIERRDAIVALGETALPWLAEMADDESASWQERLTARICFERIARGDEIRELLEHDWQQYPPYRPRSREPDPRSKMAVEGNDGEAASRKEQMVSYPSRKDRLLGGYLEDIELYAIHAIKKASVWYHHLEVFWKRTEEVPKPNSDAGFTEAWKWWADNELWGKPEAYYLAQHCLDRLKDRNHHLYSVLADGVLSVEPPVLYELLIKYFRQLKFDNYQEKSDVLHTVMYIADHRYAGILKKILGTFPVNAPHHSRMEEIKTRHSARGLADPPFRLGTEPADKVLKRIMAEREPAFGQAVPSGFIPSPANAILDLRTPERLVWRVDGPLKKDLSRETRFFVQARKAARPEAWSPVVARHEGVRAVGLGDGALLVAHKAYGQEPDRPTPFGEQAALTVHRLERFSSDADAPAMPATPAVFQGDTYGDSRVADPTFEYPTREEVEKQLQGKAGADTYRLSFKVLAIVDGSAERKIAQGEARDNVGQLRRFLRDGEAGEFFTRRHPILDLGRAGMTYWNGSGWATAAWLDPAPPEQPSVPANVDVEL